MPLCDTLRRTTTGVHVNYTLPVHRDVGRWRCCPNALIALSHFQQGQLWVADGFGWSYKEDKQVLLRGSTLALQDVVTMFLHTGCHTALNQLCSSIASHWLPMLSRTSLNWSRKSGRDYWRSVFARPQRRTCNANWQTRSDCDLPWVGQERPVAQRRCRNNPCLLTLYGC